MKIHLKLRFLFISFFLVNLCLFGQAPVIGSFLPATATAADTVTISGSNFSNVLRVDFGATTAVSFFVVNSNTIRAIVGRGSSGKVTVNTLSGSASLSGFTFYTIPPPIITSFSPAQGAVGTTVTISGNNFHPYADSNTVYFGSVKAIVTSATTTSLSVSVPSGALYKPISVTTKGLTGISNQPFLITFDGGGAFQKNSFDIRKDFSTGFANDCAIADLDGDNKNDLVVSSTSGQDRISFFRNTTSGGALSFAQRVDSPGVAGPNGICIGDVDGDGKLDVIAANRATVTGGSISILLNKSSVGNIIFKKAMVFPTGSNAYSTPQNIAVDDLNGDGVLDIVATNGQSGSISVFKNLSIKDTVILDTKLDLVTAGSPSGIIISDLNGDGKLDIAVTNDNADKISVFINVTTSDNILFANRIDLPTDSGPTFIAAGDFDGDGRPDLSISVFNTGYVSVYRNTSVSGNLSFANRVNYTAGYTAQGMAINDLDGDGKPDIVSTDAYNDSLIVLRNSCTPGSIAFDSKAAYKTIDTYGLAVGDLNGDGYPDIVAANGGGNAVSVFKNQVTTPHITAFTPKAGGAGTTLTISGYNFSNVTAVAVGGVSTTSFTVVSPNTITAVVGSGASGKIAVTSSSGTDTATGFLFYSVPIINSFVPTSGQIGTQVVIKGANFSNVLANNIVYFGSVKAVVTNATVNELTVLAPKGADYKPLSVTVNNLTVNSLQVFNYTFPGSPYNFLSTSFSPVLSNTVGTRPGDVTASDLDGDGKADLVTTLPFSNAFAVYTNSSSVGSLSFQPKVSFATSTSPVHIITYDFNGDGKQDVVIGGDNVSVHRNASTLGTIAFDTRLDFLFSGQHMAVGDMNGDAKPDIAAVVRGRIYLLQNTTNGATISFTQSTCDCSLNNMDAVEVADLNGDGRAEVITVGSSDNTLTIYPSVGSSSAISLGTPVVYAAGAGPYNISIRDVNGDGKPDITVVNYNGGTVSVFINNSSASISFAANVEFNTTLVNPTFHTQGDLDGDGKYDIGSINGSDKISLLRNVSGATTTYLPAVQYPAGRGAGHLYIGDLDGDGKMDMAYPDIGTWTLSVLRNKINEPLVSPSGSNPVQGNVLSRLTYDAAVITYNNAVYVQRHYDIEPANNPATATATVTLYFSQQDFDNFNAYPGHGLDLPKTSSDMNGKANVRIYQYHGFSASGLQGSYSGSAVVIDPDDDKIVWNPDAQWWKVTVTVNGFSGFFLGVPSNITPLPLQLLSFTATPSGNHTLLKWETASEDGIAYFEVQRQLDGNGFVPRTKILARDNTRGNSYQFTDDGENERTIYYRLKIVDKDGSYCYSKIVHVQFDKRGLSLLLYPNPTGENVTIVHPVSRTNAQLNVVDMNGSLVKSVSIKPGTTQTTFSLKNVARGNYKIVWRGVEGKCTQSLVVQ